MTTSTHDLLQKHFDTAFSAPDGIAKLRELILTLAMQGKLVEQDPKDPPASELLKQIKEAKEKASHEGTKTRRKANELPPIGMDEISYELPESWEWVRLGDITEYNGRKNVSGDEIKSDTWLLDLEDIEKGTSRILQRARFSERQSKSTKSTFNKGDVLYGKLRPYLDKVVVADSDGVCTTEIVPIVPIDGLNSEFLRWLLKRPAFLAHVNALMYGVKMPRLGTADAVMSIHPLPPLPEQRRIVAKVDQLMAKCDELEKLKRERDAKRLATHAAAIKQLTDPKLRAFVSSCEPFNFLRSHFNDLYTVKENVAELRKAILQLAVMGKLVPQDPNAPPASELLKQIEAEKKKISHEGTKTRRQTKILPPIKPDEVPYELPKGWEWVRLGDLALSSDSGWSPQCLPHPRIDDNWGVLKVSSVSWGAFRPIENKALPSNIDPRPEAEVRDGDFLLSRANTDELMARSVLVKSTPKKLMMSDKIVRFRFPEHIQKQYINLANGVKHSRDYYIANASGTSSSMKNVSREVMNKIPIPLPPLPEQQRIVTKVDELMTLCDELEQQIDASIAKRTSLLNAVMSQVS